MPFSISSKFCSSVDFIFATCFNIVSRLSFFLPIFKMLLLMRDCEIRNRCLLKHQSVLNTSLVPDVIGVHSWNSKGLNAITCTLLFEENSYSLPAESQTFNVPPAYDLFGIII